MAGIGSSPYDPLMQFDEANRLREAWLSKGNPPCDHEWVDEFITSGRTRDLRCAVCGDTLPKTDWKRRT